MALTLEDLRARVGDAIGPSDWISIDQEQIDAFAELTGDEDWLHNDVERSAKESPFGTTIVQGFFLLSLFTRLSTAAAVEQTLDGLTYALNYGFERVRFVTPVPVNARVRFSGELTGLDERPDGRLTLTVSTQLELEGSPKPAVVADWLFLVALG